jgi:predicted RNA-binding Zn ribbon-like protein
MPQNSPRPGRRPQAGAAPGQLETVRAFVNTLDIARGTDELSTPEGLARWLGPAEVSRADARQAIALREALREVLRSHLRPAPQPGLQPGLPPGRAGGQQASGGPAAGPARAAAELRKVAARLRTRLEISDDGTVAAVPDGTGPAAALARILLIASAAGTAGTWSRLKACSAADCLWAFYDRSPTRSGRWCSMRACGARAKSRSYRQRAAAGR